MAIFHIRDEPVKCIKCKKRVTPKTVYAVVEGNMTRVFCKKCGVDYEQRQKYSKHIIKRLATMPTEALKNLSKEIDDAFFMCRGTCVSIPFE